MHIILGILAVVGGIAFFIIRANMAAQAAREIGDVAGEAKGFFKRAMWRHRVETDPIKTNQDPRLAGAIIMAAIAQADSDLSTGEIDAIRQALTKDMGLAEDTAKETLTQARQLIRGMSDTNTIIRRAAVAVNQACTDDEKNSLITMLKKVAGTDGPPSDSQTESIDRLRGLLGLTRY